LGVPLYRLLGGRAVSQVRAYANVGYAAAARDAEHVAAAAAEAVRAGYGAVKFYPFGMRPARGASAADERRWIAEGIDIVRTVRAAVGDDVDILIDLMHQFQEFKQVREIMRRLDSCNLYWVEDPFAHDDPVELAELRRAIGPRLAGGAPLLSHRQWLPL